MTKKKKADPALKHRLMLQASMCVQDLLLTVKHNTGKPWTDIVYEHMEALFEK